MAPAPPRTPDLLPPRPLRTGAALLAVTVLFGGVGVVAGQGATGVLGIGGPPAPPSRGEVLAEVVVDEEAARPGVPAVPTTPWLDVLPVATPAPVEEDAAPASDAPPAAGAPADDREPEREEGPDDRGGPGRDEDAAGPPAHANGKARGVAETDADTDAGTDDRPGREGRGRPDAVQD